MKKTATQTWLIRVGALASERLVVGKDGKLYEGGALGADFNGVGHKCRRVDWSFFRKIISKASDRLSESGDDYEYLPGGKYGPIRTSMLSAHLDVKNAEHPSQVDFEIKHVSDKYDWRDNYETWGRHGHKITDIGGVDDVMNAWMPPKKDNPNEPDLNAHWARVEKAITEQVIEPFMKIVAKYDAKMKAERAAKRAEKIKKAPPAAVKKAPAKKVVEKVAKNGPGLDFSHGNRTFKLLRSMEYPLDYFAKNMGPKNRDGMIRRLNKMVRAGDLVKVRRAVFAVAR